MVTLIKIKADSESQASDITTISGEPKYLKLRSMDNTTNLCKTLRPPKNIVPKDIGPQLEIRPPYKLSITTRDYQRIRYWQTSTKNNRPKVDYIG